MHTDLETLVIALYVKIDELKARPELTRLRPVSGFAPKLSDAELISMTVMASLLNIRSERAALPETSSRAAQLGRPRCQSGWHGQPAPALDGRFGDRPDVATVAGQQMSMAAAPRRQLCSPDACGHLAVGYLTRRLCSGERPATVCRLHGVV